MVKVKEIFASIQGEGRYIGYKQMFIRFCGCNLKCKFCDTDFDRNNSKIYTDTQLTDIVKTYTDCHSVSLTGGEPLLHYEFLKEFLPKCPFPVYLETNATMPNELRQIIDYIDFVSADIKIPSCTGLEPFWDKHDEFFNIAKSKKLFAKIVFDENITEDEIKNSVKLASKYGISLVLQPRMAECIMEPNILFVQKLWVYVFLPIPSLLVEIHQNYVVSLIQMHDYAIF